MARYGASHNNGFGGMLAGRRVRRGWLWGGMIVGALLAFEVFNYSTTDFALTDLLGDLSFLSVRWSTILAIAFCGIDFAGIARLFTPEEGADEPAEVWYLLGAWLLAATMNAILTWWGVSIAILEHQTLGNAVVARETLLEVVPVFVAIMVWLSRVLIIGTFTIAGERLFSQAERRVRSVFPQPRESGGQKPLPGAAFNPPQVRPRNEQAIHPAFRPAPKPLNRPNSIYTAPEEPAYPPRPEPTYHPISAAPRNPAPKPGGGGPNGTSGGYR